MPEKGVGMITSGQLLIKKCFTEIWEKIPPSGTLQTWLPYHALAAYDTRPFQEAVAQAQVDIRAAYAPEAIEQINYLCVQFFPVFFDTKQASWVLPGRSHSLYDSVLALYRYEAHDWQKTQKALSLNPLELIEHVLAMLQIPAEDEARFFSQLLWSLPGWASFIRYHSLKDKQDHWGLELIALRCLWAWEYHLNPRELMGSSLDNVAVAALESLVNNEQQAETRIKERLSCEALLRESEPLEPMAHVVFCIDTRSGPIRAALEQSGPYTTDGMAGFWGLDLALCQTESAEQYDLCPALLQPTLKLETIPSQENFFQRWAGALKTLESHVKKQLLCLPLWVECFGVLCGFWLSLFSRGWVSQRGSQKATEKSGVLPSDAYLQIPLKDRVRYATHFLQNLSCSKMPPLLVVCGHGSTTLNNIFAAKLQCGACGNYRGIENSRLMVQILRCPQTQKELPWDLSQTAIIAAEHETVHDQIIFDAVSENISQSLLFKQLQHALDRARFEIYQRRLIGLKEREGASLYHWAQLRPEWGLAGHQALIIGPSWWGKNLSLEGRVFRHSYEPGADSEGAILQAIFQGPVNVAYLLNMQYLFPSLAPELFAAGNKMLHQLTMLSMVIQGNASDLLIGLPEQSVQYYQGQLYHQPSRLLIVVYAPAQRLINVLTSQPELAEKFANEWLLLRVYDPLKKCWLGLEDLSLAQERLCDASQALTSC